MKKVAMIPVLLGSTRIPDKNLILVDGYPMIFRVVEACKKSGVFDDIVINSEHDRFGEVAHMLGVTFYKRSPEHGGSACMMKSKSSQCDKTRCQTHDHYLSDFMETVDPAVLVQVHTTSPLLTPEIIRDFTRKIEDEGYDSLFTAEERHVETYFEGKPLNFSMTRKNPTQSLKPVQMITWALSGWKTKSFLDSYRRDVADEEGPTFCGKTGMFTIDRISALDADTWDDLYLIDACLSHRRRKVELGKYKLNDDVINIEHDLADLIGRDGVKTCLETSANAEQCNVKEIKKKMGAAPWLYLLVYSTTCQIALICQNPGEGARKHCHVTHTEWWMVLEGAFEWRWGDGVVTLAKEGDVVVAEPGRSHRIVCVSDKPGIRLANGGRDFEHIYVR